VDNVKDRASSLPGSLRDGAVTALLWVYYILGFLLYFAPFYLAALAGAADREAAFQRLNHRLHRSFFRLLGRLAPKVTWRIAPEVRSLRGSLILANHLSFLDPILFVSLFERQKTIVKRDYFRLPVFGGILKTSGYIPSLAEGLFAADMVDQVRKMRDYLAAGGNLFIFPEGTRSRDGTLGPFDKGAFKIARLCRATPIHVVRIDGTGRLFPPDRFFFHTGEPIVIEVTLAGTLTPNYAGEGFSLEALVDQARALLEGEAKG
jgi:1-acyl-sn-glycerol-3-phosphate acyltransferase